MSSDKHAFLVIGAGSHAHRVAEAICANGGTVVGFATTDISQSDRGTPVAASRQRLSEALERFPDASVAVAIGAGKARTEIIEAVRQLGRRLPPIVHPHATVSPDADVGDGSVIFAAAIVEWRATVGLGTIIDSQTVVCHEARIGPMSHIQTGTIVGPRAHVPPATKTMIGDRILEGQA